MSAIAGLFQRDGVPIAPGAVETMLRPLVHRGADAKGVWRERNVALGNRLLWTTPESLREQMPSFDSAGARCLTADARIDNRGDLIAALPNAPRKSPNPTDSDLILAAYDEWGDDCPVHLIGDFAFAIWDARREVLFCARDCFGARPFFYHAAPRLFAFASEIKALLVVPDVPRVVNETRIAEYLVRILDDKSATFYRDIFRLPPAHSLRVDRQGLTLREYWAPDPERELRLASPREYEEGYREKLTEAVRCRLRSVYGVGSLLSGGLDSSSIVCVARRLLAESTGGPLHTFSGVFDERSECDERPYIQSVVAQGGIEPHYVHPDRLNPIADAERVMGYLDEPVYAPNLFMHAALWESAREEGLRVVLDGFMGDGTVSYGDSYLCELALSGHWLKLKRELEALHRITGLPGWAPGAYSRWFLRTLIPDGCRTAWNTVRHRPEPPLFSQHNPTVHPDLARRVDLNDRLRRFQSTSVRLNRSARHDHYLALVSGMIPSTLEVAEKMAQTYSIETRFPFADRRLVEYCLALPGDQKLGGGWDRLIVRRSLASILPDKIRWRVGKADLSSNFDHTLLEYGGDYVAHVLGSSQEILEPFIDVPALQKSWKRYLLAKKKRNGMRARSGWRCNSLCGSAKTRPGHARNNGSYSPGKEVTSMESEKKSYTAPTLTVHGNVETLTQGQFFTRGDGLSGSSGNKGKGPSPSTGS